MKGIPKVISFDAFNTLFVAKRPILKIYAELGQKYGFSKTEEQLSQVFPKAFEEMKLQYPNYGKSKNIGYEDWWSQLIVKIYEPFDVQGDNGKFINELLGIFESDKGYSRYGDVAEFLERHSSDDGVIFIASSNGDPRVVKVLESLSLLHHFHKVFLSYDIEVSKPNEDFFNHIIDDLSQNCNRLKNLTKEELLCSSNLWHIGDELTNDLNGCVNAGWSGILIDRKDEYEDLIINQQDEVDLAKTKINTDFTNTASTNAYAKVLKLDDKRFVTKNFNQVGKIIGLE